jgi:Tol biopolymer transport system component
VRRHAKAIVASSALLLVTMAMGVTFAQATAPVVSVEKSKAQPLSTEATLFAELNPGELETTYRFEYGPTPAYGQSTPARTIAAGSEPVAVKASLFGLTPGTTYYFRVVASNADGAVEGPDGQFATGQAQSADNCPNAAIRAQQDSAFLPDCRAYEMITPAEKGGGTIALGAATAGVGLNVWNGAAASLNGERLAFGAWITLADGKGGMPLTYRAQRGAMGWVSQAVSPRPRRPEAQFIFDFAGWEEVTPDLEIGYGDLSRDSFDPTDVNGVADIYRTGPNEETELISRGNGAERLPAGGGSAYQAMEGISTDGSHLFFRSSDHLVAEDAERFEGSEQSNSVNDIYDRSRGRTYLLNLTNSGELLNKCGSQLGSDSVDERAVSDDGAKVFFQVPYRLGVGTHPDCQKPFQLYMRVNNTETVHVSASQRSVPDPAGTKDATFEGATTDGSMVFFSSGELLTDDATESGGLYRYDTESGDLELIVGYYETPWGERHPSYFTRVSPDGSHVYFVSQMEVEGQGVFANYNLYVWSKGGVELVGTSEDFTLLSDLTLGRSAVSQTSERSMILTPDGRHALFQTDARLTPFDNQGHREVYLYDTDTKETTCLSCDPAGQRPPGSVARSDANLAGDPGRDTPIAADGEVAVFQSGDRLVPGDVNNRLDVYQYRDGKLSLITRGKADVDSFLVGMGPSGSNVFFGTFDSLVGADKDGGDLDVYVARSGGGFPEAEPVPEQPPCQGEGCQGSLATAPSQARPSSAAVAGAGNAKERARARKACTKPRRGKQAKGAAKKAKSSKASKRCRKAAAPSHNARKGR